MAPLCPGATGGVTPPWYAVCASFRTKDVVGGCDMFVRLYRKAALSVGWYSATLTYKCVNASEDVGGNVCPHRSAGTAYTFVRIYSTARGRSERATSGGFGAGMLYGDFVPLPCCEVPEHLPGTTRSELRSRTMDGSLSAVRINLTLGDRKL